MVGAWVSRRAKLGCTEASLLGTRRVCSSRLGSPAGRAGRRVRHGQEQGNLKDCEGTDAKK